MERIAKDIVHMSLVMVVKVLNIMYMMKPVRNLSGFHNESNWLEILELC